MPETLNVKANPGEKCPREENPRAYITDAPQGEKVPASSFYRRLIADGSLLEVTPAAPDKKTKGGDQ